MSDLQNTTRNRTRTRRRRRAERGAIVVEAIVVISVFILIFVGMIFFYELYRHKLTVTRLARAAAVGFGMNGCNGSATATIAEDIPIDHVIIGPETGKPISGGGGASSITGASPPVGKGGGNPIGSAAGSKKLGQDVTQQVRIDSPEFSAGSVATRVFKASTTSTSYMTCGEPHMAGDPGDVWDDIKDIFSLKSL